MRKPHDACYIIKLTKDHEHGYLNSIHVGVPFCSFLGMACDSYDRPRIFLFALLNGKLSSTDNTCAIRP